MSLRRRLWSPELVRRAERHWEPHVEVDADGQRTLLRPGDSLVVHHHLASGGEDVYRVVFERVEEPEP